MAPHRRYRVLRGGLQAGTAQWWARIGFTGALLIDAAGADRRPVGLDPIGIVFTYHPTAHPTCRFGVRGVVDVSHQLAVSRGILV